MTSVAVELTFKAFAAVVNDPTDKTNLTRLVSTHSSAAAAFASTPVQTPDHPHPSPQLLDSWDQRLRPVERQNLDWAIALRRMSVA